MKSRNASYKRILAISIFFALALTGCQGSSKEEVEVEVDKTSSTSLRDNTPVCLVPKKSGTDILGTDELCIDAGNSSEGYLYLTYSGENEDVKLQISCDGGTTYTHKIKTGDMVIPLTQGDGCYEIIAYEGMGNGQYSIMYTGKTDVLLVNEYNSYLYPNYYVNFTEDSEAVSIGKEEAADCTCDLEVIAAVYQYVVDNIEYDHEEAETVASDYVPDVDEVLETGKGICYDYASLMAAMLRSQRIPTRLEVGYAGDAYHAWVTTYVEDIGWINGVIQFDGADWTLMDPTFAANADAKTLKDFLGDGNNYTTKYIY